VWDLISHPNRRHRTNCWGEVAGRRRKLRNEELSDLYSLPNIILFEWSKEQNELGRAPSMLRWYEKFIQDFAHIILSCLYKIYFSIIISGNVHKKCVLYRREKLQAVSYRIDNTWKLLRELNRFQRRRIDCSFITNLWNAVLPMLQTLIPSSYLRLHVANCSCNNITYNPISLTLHFRPYLGIFMHQTVTLHRQND
jgi:hypothetical protein